MTILIIIVFALGFIAGFWIAWPWARGVGFRAGLDGDGIREKWMDDATSDKP